MFATIRALWAYATFYWANDAEVQAILRDGLSVVRRALALVDRFERENPGVPAPWQPTKRDAIKVIAEEKAGKTQVLTPKPVDEWTMREWENYWRIGDGGGRW